VALGQFNGLNPPFDFSIAVSVNDLRKPPPPPKPDEPPPPPGEPLYALPDATPGAHYRQRISTSGLTDLHFTAPPGSLPNGLSLSDDGVISGTPSKTAKSSTFTVTVESKTPHGGENKPILQDFSIAVASSGGGGGGGKADPSKGNSDPSADATQSGSTSNAAVDCTQISTVAPGCTFTQTVHSLDREFWDFSLSVPIPGVREPKYSSSNPAAPPSSTRHTDLYAMLDLYPAALRATKDSAVPHVVIGLPVTGQTFYRPFFGLGENFTGWTGLQRRGFPLGMSVFFGVVDMRQEYATKNPNTTAGQPAFVLRPERVWKPMFGIEVPVSALVSKIGGASKSGSGKKGGGG